MHENATNNEGADCLESKGNGPGYYVSLGALLFFMELLYTMLGITFL